MSREALAATVKKRLAEKDELRKQLDILDYKYDKGLLDGRKYAEQKARLAEYAGETIGMANALKMWR